jgi:uncharacterized protein
VSISSVSFWQQDQNWRQSQQSWTQQLSGSAAASSVMTTALTNQSAGIASIYNQQALTRVTNQLQAAATAALKGGNSNAFVPTSTSSGILNNYATNLQSAGTAQSILSNAISSQFASTGLAGILSGSSVNLLA